MGGGVDWRLGLEKLLPSCRPEFLFVSNEKVEQGEFYSLSQL